MEGFSVFRFQAIAGMKGRLGMTAGWFIRGSLCAMLGVVVLAIGGCSEEKEVGPPDSSQPENTAGDSADK